MEGAVVSGYLRCEFDDQILLEFDEYTVTIQDCPHYRWYPAPEVQVEEEIYTEDEEEEEESWEQFLERAHVAAINVQGGKYYLVRMEQVGETS